MVIFNIEQRYQKIEAQMKAGKSVKKFNQKEAIGFLKDYKNYIFGSS
ncbi:MAG: hypothetical protein KAI26_05230 [Nanoarchaeota archaeon]|nr:hypothetical protein [Nanoarchaeota archaeon]